MATNPGLFGIVNSNRDFSNPDTWGKNQFNSSFPASLACYLYHKNLKAIYLKTDSCVKPVITDIGIEDLFGIEPTSKDLFFSFESQYLPYQKFVCGNIPRNDLVILNMSNNSCLSSYEIKLTALPDNATCDLTDEKFGSEIVIRPDTIIYMACSIIQKYQSNRSVLEGLIGCMDDKIKDWTQATDVLPYIADIKSRIESVVADKYKKQSPLIIEPIWKTEGKSPKLDDNCLDVFVWSDFGVLNLFMPEDTNLNSISRHTRTMIWLYKMLSDYCLNGSFDGSRIIDELSYNTKNDKAFSTNGKKTNSLMFCKELLKPRIKKNEIKNIILGGGQNLLSPERRFDAIIFNSPELFD